MAQPRPWKVFDRNDKFVAACDCPEYAAMLVTRIGGRICYGRHNWKMWRGDSEPLHTSESYDVVAKECHSRLDSIRKTIRQKQEQLSTRFAKKRDQQ